MYGIKVILTLGLLLGTSYARPGSGYGVKGGRNHKSTATASASARATAQASGGCPGIAQSSASATSNAYASGITSNAAATANAFVDAGNIGKAISFDDANGNADPIGDSDDPRSSNDHAGESRKESEEDESPPAWGVHRNGNNGTHGNTGSVGGTEKNQDRRPDCQVQTGAKGRRTSECIDKTTKENKQIVSKPFSNDHRDSDGAAVSQNTPIEGGFGENGSKLGGHAEDKCSPRDATCTRNTPDSSNPHPHDESPDSSASSKHSTGINGDYESNPAHPGSEPCASGASGCAPDKPSVSNPYPSHREDPDLSAGSKHPMRMDGGYGGNRATSDSGRCASGAAGCSSNKPNVSNSRPTYNGNSEFSGSSKHPTNPTNLGTESCISGTPGCVPKKPSVANSYSENPDSSVGSKNPSGKDGDYGGNIPNRGSKPCAAGAFGCSEKKPNVLNSHAPYPGRSDLPLNSQTQVEIDTSDDESGVAKPGETPCYPGDPRCVRERPKTTTADPATTGIIISVPIECSSGSIGCPNAKPGERNAHPTFQGNTDSSVGSKHPIDFNGGHGDKSPTVGVNSGEETPGYSGSPKKPGTSNPFLNGEIDVSSIKHSGKPDNSPEFKTNPLNPFLHPHGLVRPSTGLKHPENPNGDSEMPKVKPNPSNPFLTHRGNAESTGNTNHPRVTNGFPQNTDPVNGEERPVTNGDCYGTSSCTPNKSAKNHATASRYDHEIPDSSYNKPNPSNPFLPHNSEDDESTGSKHPDLKPPILKNPGSFGEGSYDRIDPHVNDKRGPDYQREPNAWTGKEEEGSNPFLVDGPVIEPKPGSHETSNPATSRYPHETPDSFYNKPNPSNPFLPRNSEDDRSTGLRHPDPKPPILKNPGSFGEGSYDRIDPHSNDKNGSHEISNPASSRYPHETPDSSYNKPNPSNPFLPRNSEDDKSIGLKHPDLEPPTLKKPGSFGESSYDRTDPHGNDKNSPNYWREPDTWPRKKENGSNPFLVDGPLVEPKPAPLNPAASRPGYDAPKLPSTEPKPIIDRSCQGGISSANCNGEGANDNNNLQNSYTDGDRGKYPSSTENYGVKAHRPGVKGGSRRRGPSSRLQENSGIGQNVFGSGNKSSAYGSAYADASASSYGSARASSSSSSGGGHGSAKSEAYSTFGGSGSSNAWASSSASSSASAFASSGSHRGSGHWEQSPIPRVPAE